MKKIIAIIAILAVLFTACNTIVESEEPVAKTSVIESSDNEEASLAPNPEVRLTPGGFDKSEVVVTKGTSLTVYVQGKEYSEDSIRYLAINGERVASKELVDGDEVDIPFVETGTFVLSDELSKATLTVIVQ